MNVENRADLEHISVFYSMKVDGDIVRNGQSVKFKNNWRVYKFHRLEHHAKTGEEWVVVFDDKGEQRCFHPCKLVGRVVKRSFGNA